MGEIVYRADPEQLPGTTMSIFSVPPDVPEKIFEDIMLRRLDEIGKLASIISNLAKDVTSVAPTFGAEEPAFALLPVQSNLELKNLIFGSTLNARIKINLTKYRMDEGNDGPAVAITGSVESIVDCLREVIDWTSKCCALVKHESSCGITDMMGDAGARLSEEFHNICGLDPEEYTRYQPTALTDWENIELPPKPENCSHHTRQHAERL